MRLYGSSKENIMIIVESLAMSPHTCGIFNLIYAAVFLVLEGSFDPFG